MKRKEEILITSQHIIINQSNHETKNKDKNSHANAAKKTAVRKWGMKE